MGEDRGRRLFLLIAARQWRSRPARVRRPRCRSGWRGSTRSPRQVVHARPAARGREPEEPPALGRAGAALAQLGPTTSDAVVSLIVFVVLGSITIAGPVVYYLVGGDKARAALDSMKGWLAVHNAAVMTVLFLVFGVKLIADGLPVLGG